MTPGLPVNVFLVRKHWKQRNVPRFGKGGGKHDACLAMKMPQMVANWINQQYWLSWTIV